jgi:hypothetical protein
MNLIMLFLTFFHFNFAEAEPKFYFLEGNTLKELRTINITEVKTTDIRIFVSFQKSPKSIKIDGVKQKLLTIKKSEKKALKLAGTYYKLIWKSNPVEQTAKHKIRFEIKSGKVFEKEFTVVNAPTP